MIDFDPWSLGGHRAAPISSKELTAHVSPHTLHLVISCWQPETVHGGHIYTTGIGKHDTGFFFSLKSHLEDKHLAKGINIIAKGSPSLKLNARTKLGFFQLGRKIGRWTQNKNQYELSRAPMLAHSLWKTQHWRTQVTLKISQKNLPGQETLVFVS